MQFQIHAPRSKPIKIKRYIAKSEARECFGDGRGVRYDFSSLVPINFYASEVVVISDSCMHETDRV